VHRVAQIIPAEDVPSARRSGTVIRVQSGHAIAQFGCVSTDLEATLVAKYEVMGPLLNEPTRRLWAALAYVQ
jgi:hypothetical protein